MVKPVSLSDPAFAALRKEKKNGESDSDVVLRLIKEANSKRKDPMAFLRWKAKPRIPWNAYEKILDEMRAAELERDPHARSRRVLPH